MTRPEAFSRSHFRAFSQITTRWFDNDVYGHMNNAMHYQLFDTAVNGHLVAKGVLDPATSPTVFLVVETGCTYLGEIGFPDLIHAGIRVDHLGRSSVRYSVGLFRNDQQSASAQGYFVHVNVGRDSRKPEPISQPTRQVLEALM